MKLLFERIAVPMARAGTRGAWFHGLRVMAIDGLVLDVPDTPANDEAFGRSGNATAPSPFPQVRLIALGECGTHAAVDAELGGVTTGEQTLAAALITRFTAGMLVLADRSFYSYQAWCQALATGAALLWRVTANLTLPVLEWLPDGSHRSVVINPRIRGRRREALITAATAGDTLDPAQASVVRAVEYMIENRPGGGELFCLITSILDHELAPAVELAETYAQRWEIELSFDEIETHQTGHNRVLRSKTPELVKQEIWSLPLTHYAIRHVMKDAADTDPDDLSFIRGYRAIRRQVPNQAGFSPRKLATALTETINEITERPNPPRRHRTYPRVIKRYRAHSHRIKRTTDHGQLHTNPPKIHIFKVKCLLNGIAPETVVVPKIPRLRPGCRRPQALRPASSMLALATRPRN